MRAISSGWSLRFRHWRVHQLPLALGRQPHADFCRSVMIQPGAMQLTRMLSGPKSRASERVRPSDGGLGGRVGRHAALADHPAGRAEVDDRAAAGLLHHRVDRLGGEELVPQVHRHALVPVFGRHGVEGVAVVAGGVVDQHRDRPVGRGGLGDRARAAAAMSRRSQGMKSGRRVAAAGDALDQRRRWPPRSMSTERRPSSPARRNGATIEAPMPEPPPLTNTELPSRLG